MSNLDIAPEDDCLIPFKDFADKIGLDERTLYRMIDEGELPTPYKQRGKNFYFMSDYLNYQNHLKTQRS